MPSHDETSYAVWDAGSCRQESNAHDNIRNSQSVADYGHLKVYMGGSAQQMATQSKTKDKCSFDEKYVEP